MLMKRREGSASRTRLQGIAAGLASGVLDRRTFLRRSGLTAGGTVGARIAAARQRAQGRSRPAGHRRGHGAAQEHLHALLGRLHRDRRSAERRVGRPGAGLGQPDQSRLALRQGRGGARAGARRPPAEVSDEARQRRVAEDLVGSGDQRDRRQDARDPRQVRRRLGVSARLGEVLQRRRLPVPQVRGVLGHQLDRPPGPHLSLHHRRRCREHLGLWRDDELLQRHAQFEDHRLHGLERGRSASGVAAAHPQRQGDQPRQRVRARSALHAHGRACDRVCALPRRHRHRGDLGHAAPHLRQRLGGQAVHRPARLRHGPDPRRGGEVDAR